MELAGVELARLAALAEVGGRRSVEVGGRWNPEEPPAQSAASACVTPERGRGEHGLAAVRLRWRDLPATARSGCGASGCGGGRHGPGFQRKLLGAPAGLRPRRAE